MKEGVIRKDRAEERVMGGGCDLCVYCVKSDKKRKIFKYSGKNKQW